MHPPDQQTELGGLPPPWTKDDTQAFLTAFALPPDFAWPTKGGGLRKVCPSYQITEYGKWLRETPYFPGLFEAAHGVLVRHSAEILAEPPDLPPEQGRLLRELDLARPKTAPGPQTTPSAYSV